VSRLKLLPQGKKPAHRKVRFLSEEWFFLKFLERWTADDIRKAIASNIDLAELIEKYPLHAKPFKIIAKRHKDKHELVNTGSVLYWFSIHRPDIYKAIVESEKGVEWIARNIEKLKKILC